MTDVVLTTVVRQSIRAAMCI